MTQEEYVEHLHRKFEKHFEIQKDATLLGESVDILAKSCNISGRTFITKYDVIDKCENYEYCCFKKIDTVTEKEISVYGQFLKRIVDEYVKPGADHMSTYVTGVIIGNSISCDAKNAVTKYSCSKAYQFYLKGWCEVRLICIDTSSNEIITNKAGKLVKKVYQLTP